MKSRFKEGNNDLNKKTNEPAILLQYFFTRRVSSIFDDSSQFRTFIVRELAENSEEVELAKIKGRKIKQIL